MEAQKPDELEPEPAVSEVGVATPSPPSAEKQDVPIETVSEVPIAEQSIPVQTFPEESPSVSGPLKNILQAVTPDKAKIAEQMGLPLKDMMGWMVQREAFEQQVVKGFEELGKKLEPAMKLTAMIEKAQQQQQTQQPASTGNVGAGGLGNIGGLVQMLAPFLSGGGGSNPMQDKILDMAIESMGLGNALVRAIIVKTAPEMATTLLKPYEKKEGT